MKNIKMFISWLNEELKQKQLNSVITDIFLKKSIFYQKYKIYSLKK